MTCFHPIRGFRGLDGSLVAVRAKSPDRIPMVVPCGRCQGCRLDRARDWSTRIAHEASLYDDNCFVTLTYDDSHIPPKGNLCKADLQKFMKRLRKSIYPRRVRYFGCGEYGDRNKRPHYHVILFGYKPSDAWVWRMSKGLPVWRSPSLEKLWTLGFSEFGSVTMQSGGYVARYCMKKATSNFDARYDRVDSVTGEIWEVDPEFMVCSTVPMIGAGWLAKFKCDVIPSDFVVIDGRKLPVPKAYRRKLSEEEQEAYRKRHLKDKFDPQRIANETPERLEIREEVQRLKIARLTRNCEDDQ